MKLPAALWSISLPDKGFHIYADAVKYLEVNCDFRYNSLAATLTAKQSVCAFCQRVLLQRSVLASYHFSKTETLQ